MYMSMKESDEDECVICFEEIDTSKKYVQCCSCMKKYHYKCICIGIRRHRKTSLSYLSTKRVISI